MTTAKCLVTYAFTSELRSKLKKYERLYLDYLYELTCSLAVQETASHPPLETVRRRVHFCYRLIALVLYRSRSVQDILDDSVPVPPDKEFHTLENTQRALDNLSEELHVTKTEVGLCAAGRGTDQMTLRSLGVRELAVAQADLLMQHIRGLGEMADTLNLAGGDLSAVGIATFNLLTALGCDTDELMAVYRHMEEIQ